MNPFAPTPPEWTSQAVHALAFQCPTCRKAATESQQVWLNRRSPVYGNDHRKKWQEFYQCDCGTAWWAWSSDRPPNEYADRDNPPDDLDGFFDHL